MNPSQILPRNVRGRLSPEHFESGNSSDRSNHDGIDSSNNADDIFNWLEVLDVHSPDSAEHSRASCYPAVSRSQS
ncbi:MAG: hypothetical protein P1V20_21470 [Verrucomicrobiales bacterium]|nr:hypothetical protein [Verrucomicrobiales bacterium]